MIDRALDAYLRGFADSRAIVNPSMKEAGIELRNRAAWSRGKQRVEAYVQAGQVVLRLRDSGAGVPIPLSVAGGPAWRQLASGSTVSVPLADDVGYAR